MHIELAPLKCDVQRAAEDDGVLVKLGRLPGLHQPPGLVIRATLSASVAEFTRPMNSSIFFGLFPAAWITVGVEMCVGMVKY